MKWYRRLFVKIFLSIWIASFLVLATTTLIIGSISEKEKIRHVITATAQGHAERVIERYEENGFRPRNPPRPVDRWRNGHERSERKNRSYFEERFTRWKKRNLIRVIDLTSLMQIAGPPPGAWNKHLEVIRFNLTSAHKRAYQVEVVLDWEQSPFAHFLRTMLSIQAVLILLVSTLAASLLTWIIVRPINRLRTHTQALYSGELATRADEKLSSRGDEIGELSREFDRMAEFVEQTLNSHQKLMQDVSHELRAPLARLQAAAGLAEQRWGDDKVVNRIIRECQRLDALIGEILTLSRLESSEPSGELFELTSLLKELVEDARFTAGKRAINFDADRCHCRIQGNPALLERALNNIIGNACKHTDEQAAIDLTISQENKHCVLTIRDHGPGVSPSALPHLFEPFYRDTQSNNGYGLGLSIARQAIQRLGGTIKLNNHPQGGLEVCIHLPASQLS
ncbi:MAG: sensor histidine kinase [Pontibacterium sp.]